MLKLLIADDEPKIRRGLRNVFNWDEFGIEIVGEAEDGEIALDMVKKFKPNIILVDICMPFLNGLEFINQINNILKDSIIIIITGYDEFSYAQQAIKLHVFDYLLKPIERDQLKSIIIKAKNKLENNKYSNWEDQQVKKNFLTMKKNFINEWLNDNLSNTNIKEQLGYFGLEFDNNIGIILVKVIDKVAKNEVLNELDNKLLFFAIENIILELLKNTTNNTILEDDDGNIIAITKITNIIEWNDIDIKIVEYVDKYLKKTIIACKKEALDGYKSIPKIYKQLLNESERKSNCTPLVLLAKNFIDSNYYNESISLQSISDKLNVSTAYLSKLLKKEEGISFIDYLTQIRIKKALQLMKDPKLKIYEIAEKVGYNDQHYFSTAFKRVIGMSPIEYRRRINHAEMA